jgi:hypothetical protein
MSQFWHINVPLKFTCTSKCIYYNKHHMKFDIIDIEQKCLKMHQKTCKITSILGLKIWTSRWWCFRCHIDRLICVDGPHVGAQRRPGIPRRGFGGFLVVLGVVFWFGGWWRFSSYVLRHFVLRRIYIKITTSKHHKILLKFM